MRHLNPSLSENLKDKNLSVKPLDHYINGIIRGDKYILSEAITLLESQNDDHKNMAYQILEATSSSQIQSRRIGITGSPGAGKSTFIESYGLSLIDFNRRVAVLTIDPSSSINNGSILGDKTRMLDLAKQSNFFIRPSPSSNHLGGTHQHTYEAIRLCEAAGYQDILIETVGVGQSETEVKEYTDLVILLVNPGSGDSLQGIKKGVMEATDLIVVTKSDGNQKQLAQEMVKQLKDAQHTSVNAAPPTITYSSLEGHGKEELTSQIQHFFQRIEETKNTIRRKQDQKWLIRRLYQLSIERVNKSMAGEMKLLESQIQNSNDSVIKEYLSAAKTLSISVRLK